jgi:hypothetical protein
VLAVDVAIREKAIRLPARDLPDPLVDRQRGAALAARGVRDPGRRDELHVALGAAEAARRR